MKIAIVGGGPSGLYLAILVKRRCPHWPVTVIEQNAPDATFGFGVVLADSGLSRLQAADAATHDALVAKMTFTDTQIITQRETPIRIQKPGSAGGGAIARLDMLNVLQKAASDAGVEIRFGKRIAHPDELAQSGLGLGLGDADVVVGADGVNSVLRSADEAGFGTSRSLLTNRFAWYGVGKAFPTSALVFREHGGGAFVAHYYPYSASSSTFVAECDQATWHKLGMEGMTAEARQALIEQVFGPELAGHRLISNNSAWRQFPVIRNAHWTSGKTVLIGDAETSAHFSIGSGTRIAMEDSIALADALTHSGDEASVSVQDRLRHFIATRGPQKAKLIGASQKSYRWYENIAEWMRVYSPYEFVHAFMTRTGRISDERLAAAYPDLMRRIQQARQHGAAPAPGGAEAGHPA